LHKGFSFVDVLQPCVSFNDTYEVYNKNTFFVDRIGKTKDEAVELSTVSEKIPLGIFYKEDKPVYHELVLEGKNLFTGSLTKEERVKRIKELLKI
jgi:2-oxoglutarate ferredoxin oxidoreductase subunit beta